jgi:hypothetical protein
MAAAQTYEPIATNTVSGSSTTDIVFTSIPSTYTDLLISISSKFSAAAGAGMYFNTDAPSANTKYSITSLGGNGTTAASGRASNVSVTYLNNYSGSSTQQNIFAHINNYSNTTTNKTILIRANDTGSYVEAGVSLWRDTSAINKITIYTSGAVWVAGSTLTLYGIKAA